MLNFFMDTYQSVFDSFVNNYGADPQKAGLFIQQETNWSAEYDEAGTYVMDHFWEYVNPNYDPDRNPADRNLPHDVGVVYADPLDVALGHKPVSGIDFLLVTPSECADQAGVMHRSYSLLTSWAEEKFLTSLPGYHMCGK